MYNNNTIGEAIYLNKSNGDYIPIRLYLGYSCDKIEPILN